MAIALEFRKQVGSELNDYLFRKIHSDTLIYNACWEDPRIDRQLLDAQTLAEQQQHRVEVCTEIALAHVTQPVVAGRVGMAALSVADGRGREVEAETAVTERT